MIRDIFIAAAAAWIVSETTDISPWLAIRLLRWAGNHMYPANAERAARRKEDWETLIDRSIPTKTSKLLFGLSFGCAGLYSILMRRAPLMLAAVGRGIRECLECLMDGDTIDKLAWLAGVAGIIWLPARWQLIVVGGIVALGIIGAGLAWVLTLPRATRKYRREIFGLD